jgi:predicted acyl esterase
LLRSSNKWGCGQRRKTSFEFEARGILSIRTPDQAARPRAVTIARGETMKMRKSEVADGMRIDWDVEIPCDGSLLRADVFRPVDEGRYPVLMSHVC